MIQKTVLTPTYNEDKQKLQVGIPIYQIKLFLDNDEIASAGKGKSSNVEFAYDFKELSYF